MRAEIVSVGTELLLGAIADTNAQYLAQRLAALGIDCYYVSQVGDNLERIREVLGRAWGRSDLIVTTGGIGPTQDDLTREGIAALLGETMTPDAELERHLVSLFTRRGNRMPESNKKQATLIPSATVVPNPVGSAPGWWVSRAENGNLPRMIVSMPGVPFEMNRMWECEVEPKLGALSGSVIVSRTLKVLGLGESRVEEMVLDLMGGSNPTLAPYAKSDGIHLRLTAKCGTREAAEQLIAPLEEKVRVRLGDAIYGVDGDTPQSVVGKLLEDAGSQFAILEVGEGAIGSLGQLLGTHALCRGIYGGRDPQAILRAVGLSPSSIHDWTLGELARAVRRQVEAPLLVGAQSEVESLGDNGGSVTFRAEVCFVSGSGVDDDLGGGEIATYSWRATRSEVGRLVGLAALNHIRHRLIASGRLYWKGVTV